MEFQKILEFLCSNIPLWEPKIWLVKLSYPETKELSKNFDHQFYIGKSKL